MKRILAAILCIALTALLAVPAFAATSELGLATVARPDSFIAHVKDNACDSIAQVSEDLKGVFLGGNAQAAEKADDNAKKNTVIDKTKSNDSDADAAKEEASVANRIKQSAKNLVPDVMPLRIVAAVCVGIGIVVFVISLFFRRR